MQILSDQEIVKAIEDGEIIIENFDFPVDPYGKGSQIQPSSLDLTIGEVFVPAIEKNAWAKCDPKDTKGYSLEPGHTALIYTREILNLKGPIGAFCFPPTKVSSRGLLVTNPGHIDPGFKGKLSFTIINMARERINLNQRDEIVTILLYRLKTTAMKDYIDRGNTAAPDPPKPRPLLEKLSHDFMAVEERAREVAKDEISKVINNLTWAPVITIVVIGVIGFIVNLKFSVLEKELEKLKVTSIVEKVEEKVNKLEVDHVQFQKHMNQIDREEGLINIPETQDHQTGDAKDK